MTAAGEQWEYCQVEIRLRNDLGTAGQIGMPALAWTYFRAVASGPDGSYIAATSREIPMPSTVMGVDIFSTRRLPALDGMVEDLVTDLRRQGWQLLEYRGGPWWEKRLRRPFRPRPSRTRRLAQALRSAATRLLAGRSV